MNDWLAGLPDFAPCVVFNKEHHFRNLIYSSPQVERAGRHCCFGSDNRAGFSARSLNCEKRILASVMSVHLQATTLLPLDGFSSDLISEYFYKICLEN